MRGNWSYVTPESETLQGSMKSINNYLCWKTECLAWKQDNGLSDCPTFFLYLCCAEVSHPVVSDCSWPHGLYPARLLCPWGFPGKNTEVGCHFLLQGIFPTQGSNLNLMYWQVGSLLLESPGKPLLGKETRTLLFVLILPLVTSNSVWFKGLLSLSVTEGQKLKQKSEKCLSIKV